MSRTWLCAALLLAPTATISQPRTAAPPPDTEIVLAPLTSSVGGTLVVGRAANITNSPGYDNQPSFTPDGRAIFFTSVRGGATLPDIYRYEVASGATSRVTSTPEGEYSATVTPDGAHISVVRVEADSTQRLWRFTLDGQAPELVIDRVKPVGYHAWADDRTLALFVLGEPATLQLADTLTGDAQVIARGISRSIQRIPGRATISFVDKGGDGSLTVRELDPKSKTVTTLTKAVTGAKEADLAWTPDGMLLMAEKDVLYGWRPSTGRGTVDGWQTIADLGALGLHGVTRIAVSPKGDQIALVTQVR